MQLITVLIYVAGDMVDEDALTRLQKFITVFHKTDR